ncbi:hypothetical protein GCM10022382_13560 [Microbacterium invictum]
MTATDRPDPVIRIAPGHVRGRWRESVDAHGRAVASAAFLGIPFAQAPVGERRVAAPLPPEPWEGVLDALANGPTPCRVDPGDTLIPEPVVPGDATLNLNVFTPRPASVRPACRCSCTSTAAASPRARPPARGARPWRWPGLAGLVAASRHDPGVRGPGIHPRCVLRRLRDRARAGLKRGQLSPRRSRAVCAGA